MYKKGRTPFCRQTVAPTRVEADKDTPKLNRLRTYFYGRVIRLPGVTNIQIHFESAKNYIVKLSLYLRKSPRLYILPTISIFGNIPLLCMPAFLV